MQPRKALRQEDPLRRLESPVSRVEQGLVRDTGGGVFTEGGEDMGVLLMIGLEFQRASGTVFRKNRRDIRSEKAKYRAYECQSQGQRLFVVTEHEQEKRWIKIPKICVHM